MPLSDLFKKSPKQEPPKGPSQAEIFGSPALQRNRVDAATEVMEIFERHFGNPREVHFGTVLSTAGWLAGTSLYRSFRYEHQSDPGTVILSEKANQEWPKLMNMFTFYMVRSGTQLRPDQFILQIPDKDKPLKTILQIQEVFQDEYDAIMKRHGLDYVDGARAGIIVSSMLFDYHCVSRKDMAPQLGAGIISLAIIEGAKTTPMPLKPESSNTTSTPTPVANAQNNQFMEGLMQIAKNSIRGSGTRLVLGEGVASMQEAMLKGGKYILVHPEVASKLKEMNVDSFLLYEIAMRFEIQSKISQIDFVGGNVDELLQASRGKPENEVPIHIRQILWMNANAQGLGYEKRGNSWVANAQNSQFMEGLKQIAKNSIGGSGARLVLGEGMASMQEAMLKGGKYILVHPGVTSKLKEINVDLFLLYEMAMRFEIEAKISQIDFIGGNVDELLQTWNGKPDNQTPIHIRQILWMNANAQGLGYEKHGNSWILK